MRHQHKYQTISTRITLPPVLLAAVAVSAGLDAASTYSHAERELALPTACRRPTKVIHAEVLAAYSVAASLARRSA